MRRKRRPWSTLRKKERIFTDEKFKILKVRDLNDLTAVQVFKKMTTILNKKKIN